MSPTKKSAAWLAGAAVSVLVLLSCAGPDDRARMEPGRDLNVAAAAPPPETAASPSGEPQAAGPRALPRPEHGLRYDAPAMTWDEGLPLGNGLLGALVWGDGAPLKISLDRTDLWDLRPVPEFSGEDYSYARMRQWVAAGRIDDLHRLYDDPYGNPGPTKIPAGRIELDFQPAASFEECSLDLAEAAAVVRLANDSAVLVAVHAERPVGMIAVATDGAVTPRLVVPPFSGEVTDPAGPGKISAGDLATLGYPPPRTASGPDWTGYEQEGYGGFRFAVALAWRNRAWNDSTADHPWRNRAWNDSTARSNRAWNNSTTAVWAVATSEEGAEPLEVALARCREALDAGFDALHESHAAWWRAYWAQSAVALPNPVLERQWYLETYKFGAAARPHTPPITLQGPWTADDGRIPPWKGDYHHDLNTELSYWPCYSGNRLDGGLGFINWLWATRDNAAAWTRRFFDLPGLNVPMTADLDNNQIGGWHQYTHSATTGAWLAHHFYLHWRYSLDRDFLRARAYPFIREVAVFLDAVTEKGPDGLRTLPLSSSPEINDNRLEAWFPAITNYDLALVRWTFATAAELANELGDSADARRWEAALAEMPSLPRAAAAEGQPAAAGGDAAPPTSGGLLVAPGRPLEFSHRHFSHLMAIHPLGLLRWDNGPGDQAAIRASLADLDRLGTDWWTGYSFAWLGCLAARARDGEKAERALETFARAFCLRNSFHCNGDQSGEGHSRFTYRPFTLEGNFAAAAAIQEMLLQSHGGAIRLFPAVPAAWRDASFRSLRAEGAFVVSAALRNGQVASVEILSEQGAPCRLADPFASAPFRVDGVPSSRITRAVGELHIPLKAGERIVLSRRAEGG